MRRLLCILLFTSIATIAARGADPKTVTRALDIRDLTTRRPDRSSPIQIHGRLLAPALDAETMPHRLIECARLAEDASLTLAGVAFPRLDGEPTVDPRGLLGGIMACIAPETWLKDARSIETCEESLTISNRPDVVDAVAGIVAEIRALAGAPIAIEGLIVSAAILDAAWPSWRSDAPFLPEEAFRKASGAREARLLAALAPSGQAIGIDRTTESSFLADLCVDQTGVSPATNPGIVRLPAGERLVIRALPLPGRRGFRIDLAIGRYRLGEVRRVKLDFADLALPALAEDFFATSGIVPAGTVAAIQAFAGAGSDTVFLIAARSVLPIPSGEKRTHILLDPRAATTPDPPTAIFASWEPPKEAGAGQPLPPIARATERLADEIVDHFPSEFSVAGGSAIESIGTLLIAAGKDEALASIRRFIERRVADASRLATVRIDILDLSPPQLASIRAGAEGGALLPPDWDRGISETKELKRRSLLLAGRIGIPISFRTADLAASIVGCEKISGGTGWTISESADPQVAFIGTGAAFQVEVRDGPSGLVQVDLKGILVETESGPTARYSPGLFEPSPQASDDDPPGIAGGDVPIDLPHQARRVWDRSLLVPEGKGAIVDAVVGPAGSAQALIVTVRMCPMPE